MPYQTAFPEISAKKSLQEISNKNDAMHREIKNIYAMHHAQMLVIYQWDQLNGQTQSKKKIAANTKFQIRKEEK